MMIHRISRIDNRLDNDGELLVECFGDVELYLTAAHFRDILEAFAPNRIFAMRGVLRILDSAESNASGNPEWDRVGPAVAAFRFALDHMIKE